MATQTFIPEMQAITPGNVQTPPAQQPSAGVATSVSQSSQQQQVSQAQTQQRSQQQSTNGSNANASSQSQQQQSQTSSGTGSGNAVNVGAVSASVSQQTTQQQSAIVQTSAQSSQQFIAVTVSEDDSTGQDTVTLQNATQAVHSTYVQYVEGNADPSIYAAANGQMTAYPAVYCVSETNTMYTPATAYYNTGNSTAVTYSQEGSVAYLVQGTSVDGESHHLTHATRVSPATVRIYLMTIFFHLCFTYACFLLCMLCSTHLLSFVKYLIDQGEKKNCFSRQDEYTVQWLLDNYETAEGVSLPRSTLYSHYLRHCAENKLDPVNAASFGKLIRSVFLGLRTRRLGTRGNSKYHYYGIRVKPNSPLNQITDDVCTMALRQQPMNQGKRFKPVLSQKSDTQDAAAGTQSQTSSSSSDSTSPQQQQHQQYLGDAGSAIPHLDEFEFSSSNLPDGILSEDVQCFKILYKEHCEGFLDAVISLQFSMVEILWQQFWRIPIGEQDQIDLDTEKRLSKTKLYLLCKCDQVQHFVRQVDYQFYQNLVDVLIPDVLRPIPSSLTQAIRNFAKSLEGWLTSAMSDCPEEMLKIKISAVSAFAQTLRRYTSLNHLAQAARAVLQNSTQINQMLADLNRVDFHNVQEQASWVCQCDDGMVQKLEQDFKMTLQQQNSLEQWAAWLEGVVAQVLKVHEGKPDFAKAARQFLLKWSFYSSMVIRDLTLRSAASFGSFHLIRLLYDEYMFYLIEHRVALATGETPIAVMGEFIGLGHKNMRDIKPNSNALTPATNGNHTNHSTSVVGINNNNNNNSHNSTGSTTSQKIVMLNATTSSTPVQQQQQNLSSTTSTSHSQVVKRLKTN